MGYQFRAEITLGPGGGALEVYDISDSRRLVTVTIFYKDKSWKQTMLIESISIDRVLKVIGSVKSAVKKSIQVIAKVTATITRVTAFARNKP